jgi:hypothetical protein
MPGTMPISDACTCFVVRPAAARTTLRSNQLLGPRDRRAIELPVLAMLKRKWIGQRAHRAVLHMAVNRRPRTCAPALDVASPVRGEG